MGEVKIAGETDPPVVPCLMGQIEVYRLIKAYGVIKLNTPILAKKSMERKLS